MTETNDVPRRLKSIRERAGLSVRAMAQRVGLSSSGYSHYETASRFKDDYLPVPIAMQIASALDGTPVDPGEVMRLAGTSLTAAHPTAQRGFSETQAAPFELREHPAEASDPHRTLRALFGVAAATPGSFRLLTDHAGFGLLRGDVVVCDMSRVPLPGDLALVTIFDDQTASSLTSLRRYLPPFLVSCDISDKQPLRTDQSGVTVRYPVIGSIRGLDP